MEKGRIIVQRNKTSVQARRRVTRRSESDCSYMIPCHPHASPHQGLQPRSRGWVYALCLDGHCDDGSEVVKVGVMIWPCLRIKKVNWGTAAAVKSCMCHSAHVYLTHRHWEMSSQFSIPTSHEHAVPKFHYVPVALGTPLRFHNYQCCSESALPRPNLCDLSHLTAGFKRPSHERCVCNNLVMLNQSIHRNTSTNSK